MANVRCITSTETEAPVTRPNIVFVFFDNLGYGELGVYGGGVVRGAPTPRIDAFAAEGLRLTNMNMEAQCTPSRSAVMTGRIPVRSGTTRIPLPGQEYMLDPAVELGVPLAFDLYQDPGERHDVFLPSNTWLTRVTAR